MTSHHDITLFTVFKAVWDETDERKCAESFTSTVKDDFIWIWCNQTLRRVHAHTRVWVWSSLKERRVPEAYIYASDKRRLASPHLTTTEDKGDTPRTENWNSFLYFCSFKYQLHKKPPARLQGSLCEGGRLDRLLTDWQGGGWQSERPDKPTVGYIFTSYRLSATLRSGLEIKIFQTFYQPLVSVCNIWPEQPNLMNCIIYS